MRRASRKAKSRPSRWAKASNPEHGKRLEQTGRRQIAGIHCFEAHVLHQLHAGFQGALLLHREMIDIEQRNINAKS